ncbi:hypothetical protein [Sphaerisporangium perillae]|uniref:hypothetical protein n=1 Tax=Sphaerisporangium perillae TaxID=2935860 RepID=UPI00200BD1D2|nr:hypothetical protein [Sphaerisporangium perillae]
MRKTITTLVGGLALGATVVIGGASGASAATQGPQANAGVVGSSLITPSLTGGDLSTAASTSADPLKAASWVRRNCGITTCSWYFSKATTRSIKRNFDTYGWTAKTAASRLCRLLPHVGAKAGCTLAVRYHYRSANSNVKAAYNRGGCVVVRVRAAYMSTPALSWKTIKFDNVPLSNRYCDAS